jgi:hypothetical protein
MQTFFFTVCLLWASQRWLRTSRFRDLCWYGLFSALLVLTRPDALFVCICVCSALVWQIGFDRARSVKLIAVSAAAGAVTVAIFLLINGGTGFLTNLAADHNNTWLRSVIIAALGMFTVFGFIGIPILAWCTGWLLVRLRRGEDLTFWGRLYLVAVLVAFPRYVIFPQKLEYIFYFVIFALLMMAYERIQLGWLGLQSLAIILPSVVTIALFHRQGADDHLFVGFDLGPSAIIQDWKTAKADWDVMNPSFLRKVAQQVYAGEAGPLPTVYSKNFGPGLVSDAGDLIIGETEAYRLDNPRSGPEYQRSRYRHVYICDKSVFHGGAGWRFLELPVPRLELNPQTDKIDVQCHRDSVAGVAAGS